MFIDRFEIKILKIRKEEGHSHKEDTLALANLKKYSIFWTWLSSYFILL